MGNNSYLSHHHPSSAIRPNAMHRRVEINDLPDELLLTILSKLGPMESLYSLVGVSQRFDALVTSPSNTAGLELFDEPEKNKIQPLSEARMDRFCSTILPRIGHNIETLTLHSLSVERVLSACQYPIIHKLFIWFKDVDVVPRCLEDSSPAHHIFKEQIKHLLLITSALKVMDIPSSRFTEIFLRICSTCQLLDHLDLDRLDPSIESPCLSFNDHPLAPSPLSMLTRLRVRLESLDDCLYLLDGRLPQLTRLNLVITTMDQSSETIDNTKPLQKMLTLTLLCFSFTPLYDSHILPLLCRMPSLENLTLDLYVESRDEFLDGNHLQHGILSRMVHLKTLDLHICSMIRDVTFLYQPTNEEIDTTFRSWTRFPVQCVVDYWPDGMGICHVYTIPFQRSFFWFMSNRFRGRDFGHVRHLFIIDGKPFEHDFFLWMAQSCPLLTQLAIINSIAQNETAQKNVFACFKHLTHLLIQYVHSDYARQFLDEERSRLPKLLILEVTYETLVFVTDNFTNQRMRGNCSKVTTLEINEMTTFPTEIVSYFPSLPKTSIHNDDLPIPMIRKLSDLIYANMYKLLHICKEMLFFWKSR